MATHSCMDKRTDCMMYNVHRYLKTLEDPRYSTPTNNDYSYSDTFGTFNQALSELRETVPQFAPSQGAWVSHTFTHISSKL